MKVGLIGFGNMASKIVVGLLEKQVLPAQDIYACAAHYETLLSRASIFGINACKDARQTVENSDVIIIAVKPYLVESVMKDCLDLLPDKMVISLAAGISYEKLQAMLPGIHCVCVMPNTPIAACQGILVVSTPNSLDEDELAVLARLFDQIAMIVEVDAAHMSIAGTIAGCAPAFAALFMEALADAGVKYGLGRKVSYELAAKVIEGTGALYFEEGAIPAAMKDAVCSPGGTTIQGICSLEKTGFRSSVIEAISAIQNK